MKVPPTKSTTGRHWPSWDIMITTSSQAQDRLPSRDSTNSYWHKEPSEILINHRTTPNLPENADVVIVGSGITGAFAARELVSGQREVLMLEAREACWGATGRNGGHCQPLIYLSKPNIARFELETYNFLNSFIRENNISCSWETPGGVHSIKSNEVLSLIKQVIARLEASHPDLASKMRLVTDPDELEKLRLRTDTHVGAIIQENAAKCWPYKLVSWVLEKLLEETSDSALFNLQTNTAVTGIQRQNGGRWMVQTGRGQVSAKHVILATNAYTSSVLPQFAELITPVRGQVCALIPPEDSKPLDHTHVWTAKEGTDRGESDDYLIQRPTGELIFGGERNSVPDGAEGVFRDDEVDPVVGQRLRKALRSVLQLSSSDPQELEAKYEWTGIMGYSADDYPWVGRVPESLGGAPAAADSGLWLSAGYTGHGMPVAARAGIAISQRIMGITDNIVEVPSEYEISEERVNKIRASAPAPDSLEQMLRNLLLETHG